MLTNTDISNELLAFNYSNVAPTNFFYVWLNTDGGAKELYFASSTTTSTPSDPRNLVYSLVLSNNTSTGQISVSVNGAHAGANLSVPTGTPILDYGDGIGGSNMHYDNIDGQSYINTITIPMPTSGNFSLVNNYGWTQINGTTNVINPSSVSVVSNFSAPDNTFPTVGGLYLVNMTLYGFGFTPASSLCYHGLSLVHTPDGFKYAKDIITGDMVYSSLRNDFVPVKLNIVSHNHNCKYHVIKEGSIDNNVPSKDLYITPTHSIIYKNKEMQICQTGIAKPVTLDKNNENNKLYSICTDNRDYILINGVQTGTWSYDGWQLACNTSHKYIWNNNMMPRTILSFPKITFLKNAKNIIVNRPSITENICIRKNAFGNNMPNRNIYVGKHFKLLFNDHEIDIDDIVNGINIQKI